MKKIGIVGWKIGDNSFGATAPYLEFAAIFGQPEILTPSAGIREDLDLIILPGGQDISSFLYGQIPSYLNSNPDLMKEFFYNQNLKLYVDAGFPIFGICLGFQQLNVFFGGSITQSVSHEYSVKSRDELVHDLDFSVEFKSFFEKADIKTKNVKVNSMHHQGVHEDDLSKDLAKIAVGPSDIVEIFRHKTLPIAGVQYHPEELYDEVSCHLVNTLLNEGKRTRREPTPDLEPAKTDS